MAKNQPVPCIIRAGGSAEEDPLVENTMRMPLHLLDQFRAFRTLRDDGVGFQLVPWRPALDPHLGQHVTGTVNLSGSVDWSFGRKRGLGL